MAHLESTIGGYLYHLPEEELNNYINGNYSELDDFARLLARVYLKENINVEIIPEEEEKEQEEEQEKDYFEELCFNLDNIKNQIKETIQDTELLKSYDFEEGIIIYTLISENNGYKVGYEFLRLINYKEVCSDGIYFSKVINFEDFSVNRIRNSDKKVMNELIFDDFDSFIQHLEENEWGNSCVDVVEDVLEEVSEKLEKALGLEFYEEYPQIDGIFLEWNGGINLMLTLDESQFNLEE